MSEPKKFLSVKHIVFMIIVQVLAFNNIPRCYYQMGYSAIPILILAAQLLLDEQEKLEAMCPACREKAKRRLCPVCGEPVPEENAGFDEGRFEELKNAGVCETASSDADEAGGAV